MAVLQKRNELKDAALRSLEVRRDTLQKYFLEGKETFEALKKLGGLK